MIGDSGSSGALAECVGDIASIETGSKRNLENEAYSV